MLASGLAVNVYVNITYSQEWEKSCDTVDVQCDDGNMSLFICNFLLGAVQNRAKLAVGS